MTYDFSVFFEALCFITFIAAAIGWILFIIAVLVELSDPDIPAGYSIVDFLLGRIPNDKFTFNEDAKLQSVTLLLLRIAVISTIVFVLLRPIKV